MNVQALGDLKGEGQTAHFVKPPGPKPTLLGFMGLAFGFLVTHGENAAGVQLWGCCNDK